MPISDDSSLLSPTGLRRAEIRSVAADLFEAKGYSGTTMTEISNAVGILPGSLYHHFTSKEEIAVELLSELDSDLSRSATATLRELGQVPVGDLDTRIALTATAFSEVARRHGAALRLYAFEAPRVATERFHRALRSQSPVTDQVWRVALEGADPTDEKALDLLRFALSTISMTSTTTGASPVPLPASQSTDILLNGLLTEPASIEELQSSKALKRTYEHIGEWQQIGAPTSAGTREDIIAAARMEFARRGFHATTIRDIAEAAGVRMGTLYRRIDSKDEILNEILVNYGANLGAAVETALAPEHSPVEAIDALAMAFIHAKRLFRQESEIVRFGWRGREDKANPFNAYFEQTQARLGLLTQVIDRGINEGVIRTPANSDSALLALQVRNVVWLPFQDFKRTSLKRAHSFVRASMLNGFAKTSLNSSGEA